VKVEYNKIYIFTPGCDFVAGTINWYVDGTLFTGHWTMDQHTWGMRFPESMYDGRNHTLLCQMSGCGDVSWTLKTTLYNSIEKKPNIGSGSNSPNGYTYDILGRKIISNKSTEILLNKRRIIIKIK